MHSITWVVSRLRLTLLDLRLVLGGRSEEYIQRLQRYCTVYRGRGTLQVGNHSNFYSSSSGRSPTQQLRPPPIQLNIIYLQYPNETQFMISVTWN
jgi:hypothetical protein